MKGLCKDLCLIVVMSLALGGCGLPKSSPSSSSPGRDNSYIFNDFEPVTPEIIPAYTDYSAFPLTKPTKWPKDSAAIRSLLPEFAIHTVVKQHIGGSKFRYLTGEAKLEAGQYVIIMDTVRFRTERVDSSSAVCSGQPDCTAALEMIQIGVGARLVVEVDVVDSSVNTGSLLPLGIELNGKGASGRLKLTTIGVVPKKTSLVPPVLTLKVDDSSVQSMLQAMSVLISKIDDDGVELTPHIVGVKSAAPPAGPVASARVNDLDAGIKMLIMDDLLWPADELKKARRAKKN